MEALPMAKRTQVTVPMPAKTKQHLARWAAKENRTVASLIRHMIAAARRRERPSNEKSERAA